jgi:cardiolipin synthase
MYRKSKKSYTLRMSKPQWKSEFLYFDNDDYYRDLIAELDKAQFSISMEVFTFEEGVLAQRLINAFERANKRGVTVRLICDGWGSPNFMQNLSVKLRRANIKFRLFRPLPWRKGRVRGESRNPFIKVWTRIRRINRGFHRKVTIIDKRIAWVSSLNVSDVHLKEVYGKNAWADIGARLEGDGIDSLQMAFEKAFFRRKWIRFLPRPSNPLVLLNDSWVRRRKTTFIQRQRIKRARRRVWIQNPYFVPERTLLQALYKAAKRNIDVVVLIPDKNDQPIVKWIMHALLDQLLLHGIKVFEYQTRFAHKKVLIVDDIYTIGSTNFNHRSLLHDQEVEVLMTTIENQRLLELNFTSDLAESIELTVDTIKKQSLIYRFFTRIMFFLRFWC